MHSRQHLGMLLMRRRMVSWEISSQTWIRASELPTHSGHMRSGIVLHQEEPRAHCTSCEPALICEENGAPMANLPILVFSGKCQSSCTVLG
ncbi:hypothetical protein SKAU_G00169020 [Synaphobranchus kaupii]|uniref:Uncharacterized protein n=1 Tax=Synaphobranchus kaupii TaxID=118154 RepID=A0A9Q1J0M9_SYNKA|nr:hypothetical protein SKAU_G00169020 [Synaphobranchus kaupii]